MNDKTQKINDDSNDNKKPVFVRAPYNYDPDQASLVTGLFCPEPTLTQQHQAQETDINYIVQQFGVTGMLPQSLNMPTYQDFDAVFDYQSAMNAIIQADNQFLSLPAEVRKMFDNSPHKFISYLENNPDPQQLVDLGLAEVLRDNRPSSPSNTPNPEP